MNPKTGQGANHLFGHFRHLESLGLSIQGQFLYQVCSFCWQTKLRKQKILPTGTKREQSTCAATVSKHAKNFTFRKLRAKSLFQTRVERTYRKRQKPRKKPNQTLSPFPKQKPFQSHKNRHETRRRKLWSGPQDHGIQEEKVQKLLINLRRVAQIKKHTAPSYYAGRSSGGSSHKIAHAKRSNDRQISRSAPPLLGSIETRANENRKSKAEHEGSRAGARKDPDSKTRGKDTVGGGSDGGHGSIGGAR